MTGYLTHLVRTVNKRVDLLLLIRCAMRRLHFPQHANFPARQGVASCARFGVLTALALTMAAPAVSAAAGSKVAAGENHSVVIKSDGSLWAWGKNDYGKLGDGTATEQRHPILIGSGYASVAIGSSHTLAIKTDGSLWAWGYNDLGQLGDNSTTWRNVPVAIATGTAFASAAAGSSHSVAIGQDGTLWGWGYNGYGQLAADPNVSTRVAVPARMDTTIGTGFLSVAAGDNHTAAVKSDGSLWTWGANNAGQLGDGTTTSRANPQKIGDGYAFVAARGEYTLAIRLDGSLWAWGLNASGQLGDGTTTNRTSPVPIAADADFASVSAGYSHAVALKADGSLWAWGGNSYGKLGDGTATDRSSPVQIGTGFATAAAGYYHTVAVKLDGAVWAWGENQNGRVGDGTTTDRYLPVQIDPATTTTTTIVSTTTTTAATTSTTNPATTTSTSVLATTTTAPATTTTTTGSTTTTTLSGEAATLNLVGGWNLLGNSASGTLDAAAVFGDGSKVTTVWKWLANGAKWAFYAPALVGQALIDYASSKGYDVLTTINGGEGFWVNAKTAFAASLPSGTAISTVSFKGMISGWNLIAVGDSPTPSAFNKSIGQTTPAAGEIPTNLTTLWAWDAAQSNWYFYAPSLEKNGGLANYIASKNYLDFGTRVLDPTTGFWANKP